MEKILYDLMDWAGIEELVYSESDDPGRLLGASMVKEGLLYPECEEGIGKAWQGENSDGNGGRGRLFCSAF